ncbi:SIR2 family histone deacetylase [Ascodesmis nigricans]|uniref:NAD-dependent protein deacetylase n=1 Tax=Ascodesmis nigricans TaxID=341454 RepID=A0A4V6RHC5_9PEZI|nr:SIR2 family histone deacetylase [Ascodesmis nigricans]
MGVEHSIEQIDPTLPPRVLSGRNLKAVADYISSPSCQKIVFMVGAGISTAAGIPDFRTPQLGLYANLARLSLPYPEAVFDIIFFRENPLPFFTLAQELWPGKYHPTLTHVFMKLLSTHNKLSRVFTQNIDTLELAAGVPREKIIFAHGSFDTQSCIDCHAAFPKSEMEECVLSATVARCHGCGGLVKPDIVFFGEALPEEFFRAQVEVEEADLVIVMGSSLGVYPFAGLPQRAREEVPRVLLNMNKVGEFGSRLEDVVWLGECDDGVRELAEHLGWWEELESEWKRLRGWKEEKEVETKLDDEVLEKEVEKLTSEVEKSLQLVGNYKELVEGNLKEEKRNGATTDLEKESTPQPIELAKEKEPVVEGASRSEL